jgi:DNA-binding XRE family transcriptional regulator
MALYDVGTLIKEARLAYGFTQEKLAEGICSRETVVKLEKGERTPSWFVCKQLMERLMLDPNIYLHAISDSEDIAIVQRYNSMMLNLYQKNYDAAKEEAEGFEKFVVSKKKKKNELSYHYMLAAKIRFHLWETPYKNLDIALENILKLLKRIRPDFSVEKIPGYFLSIRERLLINDMAVVFIQQGERDKAINIWRMLVDAKNDYSTGVLRAKPPKLWAGDALNLSRALMQAERYEECLALLEEIYAHANNPEDLQYIFMYMEYKSTCLLKLGEKEKGDALYKKAVAVAYGFQGLNAQHWLGVDYNQMKKEYEEICGTPFIIDPPV